MQETQVHKENINKKKIKLVSFLSFLLGIAGSSLIYILSEYFKETSGTENVGFFFFISYAMIFLALVYFHTIINKVGKARVFFMTQVIKISMVVILSIIPSSYFSIGLLIVYIVSSNLTYVELDSILESFSIDNMSGRIRGMYLAVSNLGYVIGPILSTQILGKSGFANVFVMLVIVNSVIFIISLITLRNIKHDPSRISDVKSLLLKVFKNKNISSIYWIAIIFDFFYALMIVYTPLYLLGQGLSWEKIGIIFTFMQLPFILLQYPTGFLADKKLGEKELMIISLMIIGFSTSWIYFVHSSSLLIWSIIMVSTRIGAAILETLRDSYFYKQIDGHDIDMIDFFRTSGSMGFMLATPVAFIILLFFPMGYIFLFAGLIMFLGIIPAIMLKDNLCEAEINKGLLEPRSFAKEAICVIKNRLRLSRSRRIWRF